jgi:hypothetical protein
MGLRETQALLAHVFTDARLREDFFAAPEATAARFGLGEEEARVLAVLDRREVEDFARCLIGKRALDARKTLPLTAKVLGAAFDAALRQAVSGPPAPERHRADAAALAALLAARDNDPPWLGDLARYEMAFVAAARPGGACFLRLFGWPVDDIARQLHGGAQVRTRPRFRLGLWLRAPGGRLHARIIGASP